MRRVRVQWRTEPTPLSTIAGELAREEDALVIVHRRDDAAELLKFVDAALGNSQTFHLSALMCPAHRREVIEKIKNEPARRVVATQLVEAGMDLDFAVVYRAMGGIDSMAQAAGRCNREGKRDRGDVCIFLAESNPPKGLPVKGLQTTRRMLRGNPNLDLLDPRTYETYFRNLYSDCSLDEKSVQHERYLWNFKTVSERVALIEDDRAALFIPYGDGEPLLKSLLSDGPRRSTLRAMQQFIVQVPEKALLGWEQSGIVRRDSTGMVAYLPLEFMAAYDCRLGLVQERIGVISASGLVA
jgi:CRISPR-associated endonuclease/helicase Cas3